MFNVFGQINWLGVAAATIATAVLGALWFTALFGKHYAIALGLENAPPPTMTPIFIAGPFLCGFVTCVATAILMRVLGISTFADALLFGLVIGFGFLAATTVNTGINPNIPHPILYGVISGSYFVIAGLTISVVIVTVG
jgi:Protein of unknown function (DUF1761)